MQPGKNHFVSRGMGRDCLSEISQPALNGWIYAAVTFSYFSRRMESHEEFEEIRDNIKRLYSIFFYLSYASWLGSKEQGTCLGGWQKNPEITRALIRILNIQVVAGRSNRYARRVSVSKTHRSDRFTYAIGLIKRIRKGRCLARSITSSNDIREFPVRIETCN